MKTAEKDLKNIRKILNNSVKEFSQSIGISEEELIQIENEERKLTNRELYTICSVLLNTIDTLLSSKNDLNEINDIEYRQRIENKKTFILKIITEFISNYHPMNQENNKLNNGTTTIIKENELINPKDTRKKMKKVLKQLNK